MNFSKKNFIFFILICSATFYLTTAQVAKGWCPEDGSFCPSGFGRMSTPSHSTTSPTVSSSKLGTDSAGITRWSVPTSSYSYTPGGTLSGGHGNTSVPAAAIVPTGGTTPLIIKITKSTYFALGVIKKGIPSGGRVFSSSVVPESSTRIECGSTCSRSFNPFLSGTSVTLTATPYDGYIFDGWSAGECSGNGTCTLIAKKDKSVTATFDIGYTLAASKSGTGSGRVSSEPAGIDCGSMCSALFRNNTSVTLTAAADAGSTFAGWSGNCLGSGINATCNIAMNADKNATATFNTSFVCTGLMPLNTIVFPGDTEELTANTRYDYSPTNTVAKCQYSCDIANGYRWGGPGVGCTKPNAPTPTSSCIPNCVNATNCTKFCGGGTATKTCTRADCTQYTETQACNTQPCPPVYKEVVPW